MSDTFDMTLDTRTSLPEDFTCDSQILILSPYLTELPKKFLYKNKYVKTLDMSKCTEITIIPDNFCGFSYVKHIIWPPNIITIQINCLYYNKYIQKIDLSYCNQLLNINTDFCEGTNIVDIILSVSIQYIGFSFLCNNKTASQLDLSYCINLEYIGRYFCKHTTIQIVKFPKSLLTMRNCICCESYAFMAIQELDFSECKDVKIEVLRMCEVKTLKLYSIDNIDIKHIWEIKCKNLHIYKITKTRCIDIDLLFTKDLQNVYLPAEGDYYIKCNNPNVIFWIRGRAISSKYFTNSTFYPYIPIFEPILIDLPLENV